MKTFKSMMCLSLIALSHELHAELKSLKASEILTYAKSAVGSRYVFGGSKWDPSNRKFGGPDCAGLVLKAWRWPLEINYRDPLAGHYNIEGEKVPGKLYTGTMLNPQKNKLPWSKSQDYAKAEIGDAFTFNNGVHGHTFLVRSQQNGVYSSIEARSTKLGVGYFERTAASIRKSHYSLLKREGVSGRTKVNARSSSPSTSLPLPLFHVVTKNDTLESLAKLYKLPSTHIVKLNSSKMKDNAFKVGDKIQIR